MLKVDHVLLGVRNLDAAAKRLRDDYGLEALPGGRHEAWGTANMLVPLGQSYLELLAVADPTSTHPIARMVAADTADGDRFVGLAIESDDVEAEAARLGVQVIEGARAYPDGSPLSWRLAGVEGALMHRRPFFIEWTEGRAIRAGQGAPAHSSELAWVELAGDGLVEWLGADVPGLRLVEGEAGVVRVGLTDGVVLSF